MTSSPALVRDVHHLNATHLRMLVPRLDPTELTTLRQNFARFILASPTTWDTWQEAWNAYITPRRSVRVLSTRCKECHGKGWSMNGYSKTGTPLCPSCNGTRRGHEETYQARLATTPSPATAVVLLDSTQDEV